MSSIEHVVILKASPVKVWSVLTNLDDYRHWDPLVQISGTPRRGAVINYSAEVKGLANPLIATANVTLFKRPEEFAWSTGIPGLLQLEEAYTISPATSGSQLVHQLRFSGLLAGIWCHVMKRRLLRSMIRADKSLEGRLDQLARTPTSTRTMKGVKKPPLPSGSSRRKRR